MEGSHKDEAGNRPQGDQKSYNEEHAADIKEVTEITLVPNAVKLPPSKIWAKDKGTFKSLSEPKVTPSRINGKVSIMRKQFSEPSRLCDGVYRKHRLSTTFYNNPAFEADDVLPTNPSFAEVVRQVINEPIAEDIHPYGRGHLYATAMKLELPIIHQEEGSLLLWFVATAVVLGLVAAVIFMSLMYEPPATAQITTPSSLYNNT